MFRSFDQTTKTLQVYWYVASVGLISVYVTRKRTVCDTET
jgi:hypothetical protein